VTYAASLAEGVTFPAFCDLIEAMRIMCCPVREVGRPRTEGPYFAA